MPWHLQCDSIGANASTASRASRVAMLVTEAWQKHDQSFRRPAPSVRIHSAHVAARYLRGASRIASKVICRVCAVHRRAPSRRVASARRRGATSESKRRGRDVRHEPVGLDSNRVERGCVRFCPDGSPGRCSRSSRGEAGMQTRVKAARSHMQP